MVHITVKRTSVPGPDLIVDCPSCHAKETLAVCARVTSREYLYGLVPISKSEQTTVTCEACKDKFISNRSIEQLGLMTTPELSGMLANYSIARVSFVTRFCALFSVLFFFVPMISVILAIFALVKTRRRRTRWRTAAWVGLVLGIAVNIGFILLLAFGPKNS